MKKLLLSVVLALSTLVAGAQEVSVKYQPEVELGYSVGTGTFATGRVNLHTVQGVRVGQYFSAGVGRVLISITTYRKVARSSSR